MVSNRDRVVLAVGGAAIEPPGVEYPTGDHEFAVTGIDDPVEAADVVSSTTVDCVVVHARSPDDPALEAVEAVLAVDPSVPVLVTTDRPNGTVAATATRSGATEYVPRQDGGTPETLWDRVRAVLVDESTGRDTPHISLHAREASLRRMHAILSATETAFDAKLDQLLALGRDVLDASYAALSRIDGESYEYEVVSGADEVVRAGDSIPTSESFCATIVESGETVGLETIDEHSDLSERAAYDEFGLRCFLGTPITVDGDLYGTLCFFDRDPCSMRIGEWETTFVELMGNWISHELERRRSERDLELARESVVNTLERIEDAFFALDEAWTFTYVNGRAEVILERDAEDLLGKHVWDVFPDVAESSLRSRLETAMTEQRPVAFEDHYAPLDVWVEVNAYPSSDGLSVYFRDVTERKRREETITNLLATTRALLAAETHEDVAEIVVEAAADVLGFEIAGVQLRVDDLDTLEMHALTDEARDRVGDLPSIVVGRGAIGEAIEREEPLIVEDVREELVGSYGPIRGAMCIPMGPYGALSVGSVEVGAFDDSDVRMAELLTTSATTALERADRQAALLRHEQVLESAEEMMYALDESDQFTLVTEPLARFLGYDRDALVGERVQTITGDDGYASAGERVREAIEQPEEDSIVYETTYVTARGVTVPVEVELSALPFDEHYRGCVGAVRDITERKERERYLQVLNRILRHNLRNDLTVVMGYAEQISAALDDPTLSAAAEHIQKTAADLAMLSEEAKLIERVLRRGRIDPRSTDAESVVEDVVSAHRDAHPEAAIEVDFAEDAAVHAGDLLAVAIDNLLENAIVHNPAPEPRVRISARTSDEKTVDIVVEDDGPGIPESEVSIIVGEMDITQLNHSSGLGLWLVRWIVASYGGEIGFGDSELGGSKVVISLERADR